MMRVAKENNRDTVKLLQNKVLSLNDDLLFYDTFYTCAVILITLYIQIVLKMMTIIETRDMTVHPGHSARKHLGIRGVLFANRI